eukprot:COSAG02_NODE_6858_length_3324_cov_1.822016_1_plen_255_part_00
MFALQASALAGRSGLRGRNRSLAGKQMSQNAATFINREHRDVQKAGQCSASTATSASNRPDAFACPRRLLIVWHSRTGLAEQMADAMEFGALDVARQLAAPGANDLHVLRLPAHQVTADDVLAADGYLFCAPENLAALSGEMKEFFDRCYYNVFSASSCDSTTSATSTDYSETSLLLGRPVGIAIAAGSDGTSAARQIERICQGWRLRPVTDTFVHRNGLPQTKASILSRKSCPQEVVARCHEIGGLVAATLLL